MMKKRYSCGSHFSRSIIFWAVAWPFAVLAVAMPTYADTVQTAVVATVAADYSGSAVSLVPVDPDDTTGTRIAENGLLAQTVSDITVASYGRYFYLIARYGENSIAKFDIDEAETVIWQYSTEGEETNSNPYDMIFVSSEKAYLIRYGSTKAWIVNPSATSEDEFKIGELDLNAYVDGADTDGVPEMAGAVIADGKLFIIMQRLVSWAPTELKPYVAVFNIETDAEIDTDKGEGDLLGIPLDVWDPLAIQYLEENDTLYVQGVGTFYPDYYPAYEGTGGIVSIDPETYETEMILDDGEAGDTPYGAISGMAIVSPTKGYFVGYDGYDYSTYLSITTLYSFDPSADSPARTEISGLIDKSIAGMESGLYTDKNNMLWVCNQTDAHVEILDISTDTIEESVYTNLNPLKVVFAGYETQDDDDSDDIGDDGGDDTGDDDDDDDDPCFINTAGNGAGMTIQPLYFILLIGASLAALFASRRSRN